MSDLEQETPNDQKQEKKSIKKRLLGAVHSKYGMAVLAFISFIESAFFPIPPDFFIVPMVVAKPKSWKRIAFIVSIFSILGSFLGYFIGFFLFDSIGELIINKYKLVEEMAVVGEHYNNNAFWSLLVAAFTPLPYKLFTIAAGFFKVGIVPFALASIIGRAGRYILVPYLASLGGNKVVWQKIKKLNRTGWLLVLISILLAIFFIVAF